MTKITKSELLEFETQLKDLIIDLQSQSNATSVDRATVVLDQQSVGRLSRMDAMQQQAMANVTQQRRDLEIRKAKAALDRIEDDEFGYCTNCGDSISHARLQQSPSIPLCLDCAAQK